MSSKGYFAAVADEWDRLRSGFFPEAVREKALALSASRPGMVAADLGAGTGFVTQALLEAGLGVFAVDQSGPMLAQLRAKFAASAAPGRLCTLEGEAESLPLPTASVDRVFSNMFLHHVENPAQAIAEMARILRPGGRLVLTDLDLHRHRFLLEEHHDRWPGFRREDVAGWLATAGLAAVSVDCCGERCCATSQAATRRGEPQDCFCTAGVPAAPEHADISIFIASAMKPLVALVPGQADPDAAGRLAQSFMAGDRPLLCAESVLLAVARNLGVESPLIPRLATGFCSGLSRSCGQCGAFSAGVMALGLALGRDSEHDDLDRAYGPVQEFRESFLERFGSTECRVLTGQDLGTPEGLAAYRAQGLKLGLCAGLLHAAASEVVRLAALALDAKR